MADTVTKTGLGAVRLPSWPGWQLDCLMLAGLAAVFRFVWLGRTSLWADEIFSVRWSALDLGYLLGEGNRLETNPPTYYLLLKGWMDAFGTSAFAVRALSALAATLAVLVVYAIGRRLQGRAFGLLAGVFIALDPNMVGLARQARGYPLLALFASLALLGLVEAFRSDTNKQIPAMVLFTLAAIAAFLMHYTAIFFIAACFVAVALRLLFGPEPASKKSWLAWAVAAAVIAVAIAGPLLTATTMSHSANLDWIDPISRKTVVDFVREVFIGLARPGLASNSLCLLLIIALLTGLWRRPPTGMALQIMIVIPVAFMLLLLCVSLSRPLLIARTGAWLTTPISLLLAWFALGYASRLARFASAAVLVLILGAFSSRVLTRPAIEDWRMTANFLINNPKCYGPLVVIGPHVFDAEYYEPGLAKRSLYWVRLHRDQPETAEAALDRRLTGANPLNAEDVQSLVAAHPGTAVVYRQGLYKVADAALGQSAQRMSVSEDQPGMHVYCR